MKGINVTLEMTACSNPQLTGDQANQNTRARGCSQWRMRGICILQQTAAAQIWQLTVDDQCYGRYATTSSARTGQDDSHTVKAPMRLGLSKEFSTQRFID